MAKTRIKMLISTVSISTNLQAEFWKFSFYLVGSGISIKVETECLFGYSMFFNLIIEGENENLKFSNGTDYN